MRIARERIGTAAHHHGWTVANQSDSPVVLYRKPGNTRTPYIRVVYSVVGKVVSYSTVYAPHRTHGKGKADQIIYLMRTAT